ncbi:MAG: L-lactate dehydrogenase [Candidatus Brocadiia bacterium]
MRAQDEQAKRVVIVGAGSVGSTFAYTLMNSGLAEDIVLVDLDREKVEGEAMDLNHGLFFAPPVSIWAGDYADCAAARVVVITAGAAQEPGESRLDLAGRNAKICRSIMNQVLEHTRDAVIVMVTNPVDVLTYDAIRHSGLPWQQVIGSGTVLDSSRFRFLLSDHCDVDPRNIHAYILGEHGDSEVAAWSMTHMAGVQMDRFCDLCGRCDFQRRRERIVGQVRDSAYHVIAAKGATYYGISQALLRIVGAILRDEHSVLTVSTLIDNYLGIEDVCLSIPCVLGREGIVRQLKVGLSQTEAADLRKSADKLKEIQDGLPD